MTHSLGHHTILFDHTALLALSAGSRDASGWIVQAHQGDVRSPRRRIQVPVLCLVAAEAGRSRLAEHIMAMPAIELVDLGLAHAVAAGALIAVGTDWRHAHAIVAARPDPEYPDGRPVLSTTPELYWELGIGALRLRTN